eukprot:642042-Prymnesium_polylepis.1
MTTAAPSTQGEVTIWWSVGAQLFRGPVGQQRDVGRYASDDDPAATLKASACGPGSLPDSNACSS